MFALVDSTALRTVASNPVVDRSRVRFHVALHTEVIAHGGPYELIGHINHGIDCGKQKWRLLFEDDECVSTARAADSFQMGRI